MEQRSKRMAKTLGAYYQNSHQIGKMQGLRQPIVGILAHMVRFTRIADGLVPKALRTIKKPIPTSTGNELKITGFKCIGSYSWVNMPSPTIMVPGKSTVVSSLAYNA